FDRMLAGEKVEVDLSISPEARKMMGERRDEVPKIKNIRIDQITEVAEIQDIINQEVERVKNDVKAATRGTVEDVETFKLSKKLSDDEIVRRLLNRKEGEAISDIETLAAKRVIKKMAQDVQEMAVKAQTGDKDAVGVFLKNLETLHKIQTSFFGSRSEAGRVLRAGRLVAEGGFIPTTFRGRTFAKKDNYANAGTGNTVFTMETRNNAIERALAKIARCK
ncbi:MAG: hypothetical protein ACE5DO_10730, partial [Desulfobacterales bacterium]